MIPNTFNMPKNEKLTFDPLPEDLYTCVISDIELLTRPKYEQPDEMEDVLKFTFIVQDEEFVNRKLWHTVRPSVYLNPKTGKSSTLYDIFKACYGRHPSEEEIGLMTSETINALIGQKLRLSVKQQPPKNGIVYNKIDGYMSVRATSPQNAPHPSEASQDDQSINSTPKPASTSQPEDADAIYRKNLEETLEQRHKEMEEKEINLSDIPF